MIVTPGVVDTFKARSKAISTMRRMLEEDGGLLWLAAAGPAAAAAAAAVWGTAHFVAEWGHTGRHCTFSQVVGQGCWGAGSCWPLSSAPMLLGGSPHPTLRHTWLCSSPHLAPYLVALLAPPRRLPRGGDARAGVVGGRRRRAPLCDVPQHAGPQLHAAHRHGAASEAPGGEPAALCGCIDARVWATVGLAARLPAAVAWILRVGRSPGVLLSCPANTRSQPATSNPHGSHSPLPRWAAWSACLRLGASSATRASRRGTTPSSPASSCTRRVWAAGRLAGWGARRYSPCCKAEQGDASCAKREGGQAPARAAQLVRGQDSALHNRSCAATHHGNSSCVRVLRPLFPAGLCRLQRHDGPHGAHHPHLRPGGAAGLGPAV